jgi:hypothetical protein
MLDTAVIPCGGLGTRFQPMTRWLPKELMRVGLLARHGQLAGARPEGAWSEVGPPDGYRSAVADCPARA